MRFRKVHQVEKIDAIPHLLFDLINEFDQGVILVGENDFPLLASTSVENINVFRDGGLLTPEILAIVRAVRRTSTPHLGKLDLPRGPIGEGVRELTIKVVKLQDFDYILILISDESEAQRVHEVRRDFVANISHELKTPIGALSLLSEAVLSAKDDPEAVAKFATRMQHEAKRLTDLVQEIINLSRLQDSDPLSVAREVSINEIAQIAVDQCQTIAQARKIHISCGDFPDAIVLGDPEQISMAIHNLIENAINYSPENTKISVTSAVDSGIVQISVTDQGIGIPEADQARIFERFYRVDPARSRETGGTGLGLSIVKHVATNHGGEVKVWSSPNVGSTFALRLPIYPSSGDEGNG
jgi:two-component system sensor histidine kinase SenX3